MAAVIIIIALTNIFVVGCMHFAFWKVGKYQNSMVLGVTLNSEQYQETEIQEIIGSYKSSFRRAIIIGYVTAVLVMIPMEWYMSIWLILYMIWMFGIIVVIQWLYIKYHKKLYTVKKKKGFICGTVVNEITIDTKLSLAKDKMPLSVWYFLPSIVIAGLPLLNSEFRKYLAEDREVAVVIMGTIILVKAAYILMYYLFAKRRSVVYSQNSEINIVCNRISKRGYSILFIAASAFDSVSYLIFIWDLMSMTYISIISVSIFCIIQTGIVIGIICTLYIIRKKRDEILKEDHSAVVVDEDEYWAKGFYYNPNDKRLFVEDRENSMHMGFNMAKKSAWIITGITILGTLALLIWVSVITLRLDFVEVKYVVEDNLQILAPSYPLAVEFDEIESVRLIEELPDVRMSKDNGAATDQYAIGRFRIRNVGRCHLYVYHSYAPIVEIKTKDAIIYFNSKTEGVTEECYQEILEKMSEIE